MSISEKAMYTVKNLTKLVVCNVKKGLNILLVPIFVNFV